MTEEQNATPRTRLAAWIAGAGFLATSVLVAAMLANDSQPEPIGNAPTAAATSHPSTNAAGELDDGTLRASDIKLSLKVDSRQCYSPECAISGDVQLDSGRKVKRVNPLPANGQWEVYYSISGDRGGKVLGTFKLYANGTYEVARFSIVTASARVPITVTMVEIEKLT